MQSRLTNIDNGSQKCGTQLRAVRGHIVAMQTDMATYMSDIQT